MMLKAGSMKKTVMMRFREFRGYGARSISVSLALLICAGQVLAVAEAPNEDDEALVAPAGVLEHDSCQRARMTALKQVGDPELGKLSSLLLEARQRTFAGRSVPDIANDIPWLPIRDHLLDIDIRLRGLTSAVVAELADLGLVLEKVSYRYERVYGLADPYLLDLIAAIPEVRSIHPNYRPIRQVGSVDSQADLSINAAAARTAFGVDGSGVRVGVVSDSFHDLIGGTVSGEGCSAVLNGSAPQLSGDLPPDVVILDNGPLYQTDTDEGAALAELTYDLAPGTELMFHSAWDSMANMAEGIDQLRGCGADVLIDDVIYLAEPMFQDGIIAAAAQRAVDAGIPFFSAAGNQSRYGVDELYVDGNPYVDNMLVPPDGSDFHDFGAGDRYGAITIAAGCGVVLALQWNDPFDGVLGPGASSDLDLYLCLSQNPADCIFGSATSQGCGIGAGVQSGDPLEVAGVVNTGTVPGTVYAAVDHFCGDEGLRYRIAVFPQGDGCSLGSNITLETGIFDKSQIYGHPAAQGVTAVGAVFYNEIDTGGNAQSPLGVINVEPFSSLGGELPFYFDESGNPLPDAPVLRFKPEIAAPDGTNTTFFGADIITDPDMYPNMFGTSPASAHAAGIGALLRDRSSGASPAWITRILMSTATDIETVGIDALSGAGLIDAYAAVEAAPLLATKNDFQADGFADILMRNVDTGRLRMWQMDGPSYEILDVGPLNPIWDVVGVGDFGGDWKADVLMRNHDTGRLQLWTMDGAIPVAADIGPLSLLWKVAGIGDFGGDGKDDILLRHSSTGDVRIWHMDGASYVSQAAGWLRPEWMIVGIGDMSDDGIADVVLRHEDLGRLRLWQRTGSGFVVVDLGGLNTTWRTEGVGDFDANGRTDILIRHVTLGRVRQLIWNGSAMTMVDVGGLKPEWWVVGIHDYTGDGKTDLLLRHQTRGRLRMWEMDGASETQLDVSALSWIWAVQ